MEKIIIAAVSQNGVIGKDGIMPWHSKEDFQHFKRTTMGYPLIMGRKTFEALGNPLKGRLNIILTKNKNYRVNTEDDNVKIFQDITDAYKFCENRNEEKIFVIGGGQIYEKEINNMDKLVISEMKLKADGNVYFPVINKNIWKVEKEEEYNDFVLKIYVKK